MRVFLSWSGLESRRVAGSLRDWLPGLFDAVEPWTSSEDLAAGARWSETIAQQLRTSRAGVICLTPDNVAAPWLHFEAGALSNAVGESFVCPYLLGVERKMVPGPLAQFQSIVADREGTFQLVQGLNVALGEHRIDDRTLKRRFDGLWPELERELGSVPTVTNRSSPPAAVPDAMDRIMAEMERLREQLVTHGDRLQHMFNATTRGQQSTADEPTSFDWTALEGLWEWDRSLACARVVDGKLRIPYSYEGSGSLDSEFYDLTLVDNVIYGRFRWFETPIRGYIYLRIESPDRLRGGWWYDHDLPPDFDYLRDHLQTVEGIRPSYAMTWRRQVGLTTPDWANAYFDSGCKPPATRGHFLRRHASRNVD